MSNKVDKQRARHWLAQRARPARNLLVLASGAGLTQGLLIILQSALIAHVVHAAVIEEVRLDTLWPALLGLPVIFLVRAVCAWGQEVAGVRAATRIKDRLREELYAHLLALGPVGLGVRQSGTVSTALLEQVEALEGYYARFYPQMIIAVGVPLLILLVVFPLDWLAALLLLFTAPLIPLFMALVGFGAEQLQQQQLVALGRLSGWMLDRITGLTTLRLFGHTGHDQARLREASDDFRQRTMKVLRVGFLSSAVLEFFASVAIAMLAIYIGLGLLGYITFGPSPELTLFSGLFILLLAPEFFQPLRTLATHYHDRAGAIGAAEELIELLETPPIRPVNGNRRPTLDGPPALRLEGVSVTLPGGVTALRDCSMNVAPGERVVVAGPSGCGKSTLIHLLLGLVEGQGDIRLNGHPLRDLDPTWLREHVAWVGQRAHLFHGTLADNIALGYPGAPRDQIEAAARKARVTAFSRLLPAGLDSRIGERGEGLSGGEAQRVAVARALLRDTPLLLLDEPTAHLDPENEQALLATLAEAAEGRTVIMTTHRPAGMAWADRVLTLRDGQLREATP
ncbi:thiol reductant ABC exporter subunit CydD [Alkalilimnicola ehrlichii MLHE-1]|uniref:ABC transporter related protein n=1 Tax=Alkalilimnicola ehrlichii (strain ATCC BAA-1101 / DSM 17681 / MLHE-1) TaxID=187272 RepID=Q0A848_ALKEH|nr:thiol reductant ABC exporter subunit CydD [Alkalilimnicola ehrlichii]ABI56989.1 ABC transporter related protein [Alkalilimnicola ehrlichii MLHE-1]